MLKLKALLFMAIALAVSMLTTKSGKVAAGVSAILFTSMASAAEVAITLIGFGSMQYDDITGAISSISPTTLGASVFIIFVAVFSITLLMTGLRKIGVTGKKIT